MILNLWLLLSLSSFPSPTQIIQLGDMNFSVLNSKFQVASFQCLVLKKPKQTFVFLSLLELEKNNEIIVNYTVTCITGQNICVSPVKQGKTQLELSWILTIQACINFSHHLILNIYFKLLFFFGVSVFFEVVLKQQILFLFI